MVEKLYSIAVASLFVAIAIAPLGCRKKVAVNTTNQIAVATTVNQASSYETAINFLHSLERYRPETVQQQILANLRDWSRDAKTSVDWTADPMFNRLPSDIRELFPPDSLAVTAFERYDVLELQEAVFMRDIAKNVASNPVVDPLAEKWFDKVKKEKLLPTNEAADLSIVFRLFDWTVRNIQLDALQDPDDFFADDETNDPKSLRHQYFPWETLQYGHGDWVERSRVFISLCRQMGIDAVMLVAESDQADRPWVVAASVGQKLFLFDAKLGLPLPGQGDTPFGTLTDYVQSPELLDRLSETGSYRIATSDLKNLVACIDASPASLSQRMKQVESKLTGKQKMVLTCTPSRVARAIRSNEGINRVEIWEYPYRGYQFVQKATTTPIKDALRVRKQREAQPFVARSPLMRARFQQFSGKYIGSIDAPGANKLFQEGLISNKALKTFSVPMQVMQRENKESPFLQGLPQDPAAARAEYDRRMSGALESAIWNKDHSIIWMAMVCLDSGQYKVASDHLKRILTNKKSNWRQLATYNLARTYEAIGLTTDNDEMLEQAVELYKSDTDSPQSAGNLLRAQRLQSPK